MDRKIQKEMVAFLDEEIAKIDLTPEYLLAQRDQTLFWLAAKVCVGIREVGGNNSGPLVELMQRTLGGADKEAWCMSFVQTCIAYVEEKRGLKSQIYPSEACVSVWVNSPAARRVAIPTPGDIAIWQFNGTAKGHCAVVDWVNDKFFGSFEGNTEKGHSANGEIVREGGGVYTLTRDWHSGSADFMLRGFLRPFGTLKEGIWVS